MKFNFRQGIQHSPMTVGHPDFLTYASGNDTITLSIGIDLVRATAAWHDVNYLIEERETSVNAWGPMIWDPLWGTNPGSFTSYLYWDINLASGALSKGFTHLLPAIETVAPISPSLGQHWFDTSLNVMKVWDGVRWNQKIRVFAASYDGGTHVITEQDLGSQVGIFVNGTQETWFNHGYILFGIDQKAIKNSDGSMVTTAVPLNTYHGSFSSPIRLELSNSLALASESIPAFSAIASVGNGTVRLANGANLNNRPIGITLVPYITGDAVDIVFNGIVYNDQWAWDYTLGKDLYCGSTGILYQGNDIIGSILIGTILDSHTVLINIDIDLRGGGGLGPPFNTDILIHGAIAGTGDEVGAPTLNNTRFGVNNQYVPTTGTDVTSFGFNAASVNAGGNRLVAIGSGALQNSEGDNDIVAIGYKSCFTRDKGDGGFGDGYGGDTAVGTYSLYGANSTSGNAVFGYKAGYSLYSGIDNSLFGAGCGENLFLGNNSASAAVGTKALFGANAIRCSVLGAYAAQSSTDGVEIIAIGYSCLLLATGSYNIGIGSYAGSGLGAGSYNVIIGNDSAIDLTGLSNHVAISDGMGNRRITINEAGKLRLSGVMSAPVYQEDIVAGGSTGTATIVPDILGGSVAEYTLTGDITLNSIDNIQAGMSMTIILTQDATGSRLLTSTMKFVGGSKILSTAANAIDMIRVLYTGTQYLASLTKDYV